jgi:hypothetical protein
MGYFGKLDSFVKLCLLTSYCYSLYGSVLWDLSNNSNESLCIQWHKGLRHVWGLPYNARSAPLHVMSGCLPVFDETIKCTVLFI